MLLLTALAAATMPARAASTPDLVVTQVPLTPFATNNDATYRIIVGNIGGAVSRGNYRVDGALAPQLLLARAPLGNGWSCTGAQGDTAFTCTSREPIAPTAANENDIAVSVVVLPEAVGSGTTRLAYSVVRVSGGGEARAQAPGVVERAAFDRAAAASAGDATRRPARQLADCPPLPKFVQNACRTPTTIVRGASIGGMAWFDRGEVPGRLDAGDERLASWHVEIVDADTLLGQVVRRTSTGADGRWQVTDLIPAREYLVRFRDPSSGVVAGLPNAGEAAATTRCPPTGDPRVARVPGDAATLASTRVCVEDEWATQLRISLAAGANFNRANLAHAGAGTVYDVTTGAPVTGAVVTLSPATDSPAGDCARFNPAEHIVNAQIGGYRIAGASIAMTTGATGAWRFAFTSTAPTECEFRIDVSPPGGYRLAEAHAAAGAPPRLPPGRNFAVERVPAAAPAGK